jgi:prephenate dehydratase
MPNASVEKMASTSGAAQALTSPEYKTSGCAAICSKICAEIFDGLDVLLEGIQDKDGPFIITIRSRG